MGSLNSHLLGMASTIAPDASLARQVCRKQSRVLKDCRSTKRMYGWPLLKSDTTIQRYTEPELEPCINYATYCLQSPRVTSVITFSGGRAHIPKNISYKAPLHQMIACMSMFNRLKYWHAQSDNLAYLLTYYVVDNNIYIDCA